MMLFFLLVACAQNDEKAHIKFYVPEATARQNAARQQQLAGKRGTRHTHRHTKQQPAGTRGSPVWVYIHGGGLTGGSGNFEPLAPFAAHARAANGESVIVVSINYRLNIFGFLALKELSTNEQEFVASVMRELVQKCGVARRASINRCALRISPCASPLPPQC